MHPYQRYCYITNLNDAGTVRANQTRLVLFQQLVFDLDHIQLGNSLRDDNDQLHLRINCLDDALCGKWRRYVDY